jgi:hypothetical protein
MDKYVLLIISVAALNVIYYTLEWREYRKENFVLLSHKRETTGMTIE